MLKKVKKNASKIVAGFLALLLVVNMIPSNMLSYVLAAEVPEFTVELSERISATVTMTNESDAEETYSVTAENGVATFKNVIDSEKNYTLTVTGMENYKNYSQSGVSGGEARVIVSSLTEKDSQTIAFAEETITKTYGDEAFAVSLSETVTGTGDVTYTSSNEQVATINSNGIVTICGAGTTEIKVQVAADDNYKAAEDTLTLTVEQASDALTYEVTEVNWAFKDKKTNPLTVKSGATGKTVYESSNSSVAKVNSSTGEVEIKKPGTAVITAKFTADANSTYKDSVATYTINAVKKTEALYYENVAITKEYGDAADTNSSLNPTDTTGIITYSSSNTDVATVDETTGKYTIVGAGETTITATLTNDANYEECSASYKLTVNKKADALSFAEASQSYTYGDKVTENKLTVTPDSLQGTITYTSSDATIVAVDASTGEIVILKSGSVVITASIEEEANYKAATASYKIEVAKKEIAFEINEEIEYGQADPDLTTDIKTGVNGELVAAEKDNTTIIERVAGCISYLYENTPADEDLRSVGTYAIEFTYEEDDCYSFNLTGQLTVKNDYDPKNEQNKVYEVVGLNADNWGSATNTVVIRVTNTENYRISTTGNKKANWDQTELVYETAEEMKDHKFYIRDLTTNRVSKVQTETFGIDGTNPEVTKFEFKNKGQDVASKVIYYLTFGMFCNEEIEVTVTASDGNVKENAGVDYVTLYYNDVQYGEPKEVSGNTATFTLSVEEFATLKTIAAIATDKVGNVSDKTYVTTDNSNIKQAGNGMLQLEADPADIEVTYDPATSVDSDENKWYGEDIDFKVKVTDAGDTNSGIRSVWVTINGETVDISEFTDSEGEKLAPYNNENEKIISSKDAYYFIGEKTEEVNFTINTKLLDEIPINGKYVIKVYAVDNAGTQVEYNKDIEVYIDRNDPVITNFVFNAEKSIEGEQVPVATLESYGYFFQTDTVVTVTAKDVRPSAGVKEIVFYTVDKDGNKTEYLPGTTFVDSSDDDTVIVSANFTVPEGFKGQIYARAIDNVEHTTLNEDKTPMYFNPNGTAIENEETHKGHSNATVTLVEETKYTDCNGLPLYKDEKVQVKLYVKDTFSGIKNITWAVKAPYNATENDANGTTEVGIYLDGSVKVGDEIDGWTVEAVDNNLVTEMSRVIEVTNNSNAIAVELSFNDRALNGTLADILYFSIDRTIPEISVSYDNNTPDETYTDIYKEDREATIVIYERNFRAEDVVFAITNTDNVLPTTDLTKEESWTTIANTENPDLTEHVAKIKYTADGDYTFDISYKDNAENAAAAFEQHKFTIDKTLPVLTVVYDNNSAQNGNYYKADRIATITIKEHNFDATRVNVIGVATDNGAASVFPSISAWTNKGNDTYTATIAYTSDSKYSFDIEFVDKAGNGIADYTVEEFYVDKTAPTLTITGVEDKSANNGQIAPIITYSDTNFDKDKVSIVLSGINNGEVQYSGTYKDDANGQTYTYANFEEVQKVDDIYTLKVTLTDKAGNSTEKTITFSANRFGSVYDMSEVEDIIGKYLQKEQDIVFTETNVDTLDRNGIKIKLTKNGTPTDLVQGKDYTVEVSGGNGQWSQYKYTINKELFADDGRYSISIYSVDAAGNINENIDETKDAEISFGIDKTKPVIVPIDFEGGVQYAVEEKVVSIEIKDNLVLQDVKIYLNDKEVEYTVDGETYTFTIPASNSKQDVRIVVTDAAGNEYELPVNGFLVSTNLFVRWYNNTPLFVGSIIGVVVLAIGITTFILFGKKKKDDEEEDK